MGRETATLPFPDINRMAFGSVSSNEPGAWRASGSQCICLSLARGAAKESMYLELGHSDKRPLRI